LLPALRGIVIWKINKTPPKKYSALCQKWPIDDITNQMHMNEVTAGIDIGGIDTEIGLVTRNGTCVKKKSIITGNYSDATKFIQECADIIIRLCEEDNLKLNAIGVAAPNGNPNSGAIENAVNLSWKGIVPFAKMLQTRVAVPVTLTNDAKAAAVGEKLFGGAKRMENFILITLGAGLGSGIYTHGHLLTGNLGLAGEMGHMIVSDNGRTCNTKRKGCLEAYASVTGLKRTVFSLLADTVHASTLRDYTFSDLTGKQIWLAARSGDRVALDAFESTGRVLGKALANVISLLDTEAIFFAGGLAHAGDLLLKPTQKYIDENVFPAFEGKVKLLISELLELNGGMMGASALAWEKYRPYLSTSIRL
jgi:glucokinase